MNHRSRQYLDAANTTWIRGFTTFDLGVRYALPAPIGGGSWLLQAEVSNVLDENYWANGYPDSLGYGDPRIVKVSASVDS